jgi:uncharacterized protein YbjT (DUF2867 family)
LAVTDPELIETFDNLAFDEVLHHGHLNVRTRLMVQLAAIIACQALREYRVMLGAALAIGVTPRTEAHDWKRRSERLVRASGLPYTIVRPGWFDYNGPDEHRLLLLQGDRRQAGDPSDGGVARRQITEILVRSLKSDQALRKTFELIATTGAAPTDFDALFAELAADPLGTLDGVHDMPNMPLDVEPQRVRDDLGRVFRHSSSPNRNQHQRWHRSSWRPRE